MAPIEYSGAEPRIRLPLNYDAMQSTFLRYYGSYDNLFHIVFLQFSSDTLEKECLPKILYALVESRRKSVLAHAAQFFRAGARIKYASSFLRFRISLGLNSDRPNRIDKTIFFSHWKERQTVKSTGLTQRLQICKCSKLAYYLFSTETSNIIYTIEAVIVHIRCCS